MDVVHIGVDVGELFFEAVAYRAQRIVDFLDGDGKPRLVDVVLEVLGARKDRGRNRNLDEPVEQAHVGRRIARPELRRPHPEHALLARAEHNPVITDVEHIQSQPVAHFRDDVAKIAPVEILMDEFPVFRILYRSHARLKPPLDERRGAKNIGQFYRHG